MKNNHKVPEKAAQKWIGEFDKLKKGLKVNFNNFFLENTTWKELSGIDNLNRIRVYFGLETRSSGKPSVCAFAVETKTDGSGVHRDQISKIFKLEPKNINVTSNLDEVKKIVKAWREWRNALDVSDEVFQKKPSSLFPVAFLLHADDLKTLFSKPGNSKIKLELGRDTGINLLMMGEMLTRSISGENEYFDFSEPCPPDCDPESPLLNLT